MIVNRNTLDRADVWIKHGDTLVTNKGDARVYICAVNDEYLSVCLPDLEPFYFEGKNRYWASIDKAEASITVQQIEEDSTIEIAEVL